MIDIFTAPTKRPAPSSRKQTRKAISRCLKVLRCLSIQQPPLHGLLRILQTDVLVLPAPMSVDTHINGMTEARVVSNLGQPLDQSLYSEIVQKYYKSW